MVSAKGNRPKARKDDTMNILKGKDETKAMIPDTILDDYLNDSIFEVSNLQKMTDEQLHKARRGAIKVEGAYALRSNSKKFKQVEANRCKVCHEQGERSRRDGKHRF